MNFWDELYAKKRFVMGLSPMDGVTDAPMRYMTAKYSSTCSRRPVDPFSQNVVKRENGLTDSRINETGVDLLFTEFVSVDALHYATGERRERLLKTFIRARDVSQYCGNPVLQSSSELQENGKTGKPENQLRGPYEIAQVFGNKPDFFVEAAKLIESLGFDGIDINMGCPAHKVEENGSGAGLIRTPELAKEIVLAVKGATSLPVSVKTRIGVDKDVSEWWMETLMEVKPANITLHGRTLKQLYQGSADWESIGRAAAVVHKHGGHILGNGDVESSEKAKVLSEKYGVDGVLIGRAAEGNPGIFRYSSNLVLQYSSTPVIQPALPRGWSSGERQEHGSTGTPENITQTQRLAWMIEHAKIFEKIFKYSGNQVLQYSSELPENGKTGKQENDNRWFMPMRKHLAWYCKGFPGAVEMRSKLMQTNSADEVERIVTQLLP